MVLLFALWRIAELTPFSPSILSSSRNLFILGDYICHHPFWDSKGIFDTRGEEVFDWAISSDLLSHNDPDTPTLLHCFSANRFSLDILFAPSSLVPGRCFRSWVLITYQLYCLFPYFCFNVQPPPYNFQKTRWNDFAFFFDTHCPSADEYSSFFLLLLSLPLWHKTRPNFPLLSAASNDNLPNDLLKR